MGEISFLKRVAWRWCGVQFFAGTKGPFGGFLLPETDPLGPAGARVLIIRVIYVSARDGRRGREPGRLGLGHKLELSNITI